MHTELVKTGRVVPKICPRTDKHTDRQTDRDRHAHHKSPLSYRWRSNKEVGVRHSSRTAAAGERDELTDGRTPESCTQPAPHTMRSVPILLLLLLLLLFTRAVYATETAARSGTDMKIDRPVTAKTTEL